jgi:PAS domain S-box-containing protein
MEEGEKCKLFDAVLSSITDGVFTTDSEGRITFVNKAAEDITGYTAKEAFGQHCYDIFRSNICLTRCALKETVKTKKPILNLSTTILNKDGKEVPISLSTAVLTNEKGQIIGGVETFRNLSPIEGLKKELSQRYTLGDIISKNHRIHEIFDILPGIAESNSTVLIQGPSGTGKELFAKAIHTLSRRNTKPFIKVNCGALPDPLLESELFGYVKGAFTDAKKDKPGRFALADGGTILLDEVGDMSPSLQVKLLRTVQEKEYEPLGSTRPRKTDVRIIAATNKDLSKLVREGNFREDLFYRLNVVRIELPPLSERKEDIPLLVNAFIEKFNARMGKGIIGVSNEALKFLLKYDYPGNVRELENMIERAFAVCNKDLIGVGCLSKGITGGQKETHGPQILQEKSPLEQAEAKIIDETMKKHGGNRIKTAQELGMSRITLWRKIKKYNLVSEQFLQ